MSAVRDNDQPQPSATHMMHLFIAAKLAQHGLSFPDGMQELGSKLDPRERDQLARITQSAWIEAGHRPTPLNGRLIDDLLARERARMADEERMAKLEAEAAAEHPVLSDAQAPARWHFIRWLRQRGTLTDWPEEPDA